MIVANTKNNLNDVFTGRFTGAKCQMTVLSFGVRTNRGITYRVRRTNNSTTTFRISIASGTSLRGTHSTIIRRFNDCRILVGYTNVRSPLTGAASRTCTTNSRGTARIIGMSPRTTSLTTRGTHILTSSHALFGVSDSGLLHIVSIG